MSPSEPPEDDPAVDRPERPSDSRQQPVRLDRNLTPRHSPVRPTDPPTPATHKPRLIPTRPPTESPAGDSWPTTGIESMIGDPESALARLRERMAQVSLEFANGLINRAQFHAIYSRYSDQRRIIETLLTRDPTSQAWQQVARPGHTRFLREHFTANVLFFAVFVFGQLKPIAYRGDTIPRPADVMPVLRKLPNFLRKKGKLGPARMRDDQGHWLVFVPGRYTVSLVLYSLEPSTQQIAQAADLHADFERANMHALAQQDYTHDRLVFPQRALFK